MNTEKKHSNNLHYLLPDKRNGRITAVFFLILIALPIIFRVSGYQNESYVESVLILCMLWSALTLSWDLLMGYTGIWSLAQQVFFGIAAYASSMLNAYLGMNPWVGFLVAPLFSLGIGVLFAFPIMRLKAAPYIIIATMCLSEIVRLIFTNLVDWTRGELGFWQMDSFSNILGIDFSGTDKIPYYYLMFIIFIIIVAICSFIGKSKLGLAMKAIRDSQGAAESLGVNITKTKLIVFALSSWMAGVCGVFYAHYMKILTPTNMFSQDIMTQCIAMDVFGGIATIRGPIFGGFFITIIMQFLQGLSDYRLGIYAIILIVTTLLLPNGVLNSRTQFLYGIRKLTKKKKNGAIPKSETT